MCIAKKGLNLGTTAHKRVAIAYNLNPVNLRKGCSVGASPTENALCWCPASTE